MKQKYQKRPIQSESVNYLVDKGVSRAIAEVLVSRGINETNFDDFVNDTARFHSPFEMTNMTAAVETINYAIDSGGKILIYGDYDADGLTASSILSLYFTDIGVENNVIIPTRDEGYGLHAANVFRAFERDYYDLVITVDCGISNAEDVEKIQSELGVEVIVTDHHELPSVLPDCICVNPKLGYPFAYLSGAGVAWKLVEALGGREAAVKYSDLACVGTIGDLMPLQDENRALVKLGLSNMNHKSLRKLAELSNCGEEITCADVSLRIAPKINAAGRVESPQAALDVLLSRDKADTGKVSKLLQLNEKRKQILEEIVAQSDLMCDAHTISRERMVFLYSDNWQHGLLGIVASRYKEKYKLPTVIMTLDGNSYVGSARGIDTINLYDVFCQCDCLEKFGGHKASVGFSVAKDRVEQLRQSLVTILGKMDAELFNGKYYYDVELGIDCDVSAVMETSKKLQPLLPQDKIICYVSDTVKFANSFGKDDVHMSATLTGGLEVKGFFKYGKYVQFVRNGANVQLLCSLETDNYSKNVTGILEDITLCNSVCFDEFYRLNLLKNFNDAQRNFIDESQVGQYLCCEGTLVVFDDYETYLVYCEKYDLKDFAVDIFYDGGFLNRAVAISPAKNYPFDRYERVVYFANPKMTRDLCTTAIYVAATPANRELYNLDVTRDVCTAVYAALRKKSEFESIKGVYDKYLAEKISYAQYIVALRVFEELKLIDIVDKFTVHFDGSVKRDLSDSYIYKCFQKGKE